MTDLPSAGHGLDVAEVRVFGLLALALALAACGSEPVAPGDGGSDSGKPDSTVGFPDGGGDASDAGDGACTPGVCPTAVPSEGTACNGDFFCEYGTGPLPECNTTATCIGSAWHIVSFDGGCTQNSQCPGTFAAAQDGGPACGTTNFACAYSEGTCGCAGGSWACATPGDPSCPTQRPRYGTACTGSLTCAYGADCTALAGPDIQCACGRWKVPPPPGCPPSP
jgi:hypothetical protein